MAPSLGIIVADFTTQLAADIIIGGTTGTLSSATDDDGVALASGHYFFTIDGGNSAKEHISCDLVGTALTNIKSVSRQGVETTGVVRKHRIGASISITDFAHISKINDVMRGVSSLDGTSPLQYDVEPTFTDRKQLISKSYADDVLSGVVGTASDTTSGTIKTTKNQSTKARTKATLVREQNTPDMTLKVESFKLAFIDQNTTFAGGNSPAFINPGLGGDLAISSNPSNTETVTLTINGTACVFTFVTSIGATPGNILIQGTAAATRAALATFIANPGTTNANQVAFTGAQLTAMGLVSSTDDLSANLFIRANSATVTTFTGAETMAGGSNTWTANTTKNRLDLLVLNGGSLAIRKGSEAVSPVVPTPTTGDIVLCSVYNIPGETTIKDKTAALAGYIDEMFDLAVYRTDLVTTAALKTTDVQAFTTAGTTSWTKPTGAKYVEVTVIGGGGAGGSGTPVNNVIGGGGGGWGHKRFDASALGATETVVVGAGGVAGANNTAGGSGGYSAFGTTVLLRADGGTGGSGTGTAAGGSANGDIHYAGGNSGTSYSGAGVSTSTDPSPRGGGSGGYNGGSPATATAGGAGGGFTTYYVLAGGTAGPAGVNAGGAGNSPSTGYLQGGTGGGGGGYNGNGTNTGGNGGAGGFPGGGGGGSVGTNNVGGNGAKGMVYVVTYF